MSSSGSGREDGASADRSLVKNDMQTTVLTATLEKVLGALHSSSAAQYSGMTNTTEAGRAALRSRADELGSKLADLAGEKVDLEQLQQGPSIPAVGAAPAAPPASAPPPASLPVAVTPPPGVPTSNSVAAVPLAAAAPPATKPAAAAAAAAVASADPPAAPPAGESSSYPHQTQVSGRKRPRVFSAPMQATGEAGVGGAASTPNVTAEESGDEDTARPHGGEAAAAAAAAGVASAASAAMSEEIDFDIDCSDNNDKANGVEDEDEQFVTVSLPAPSLKRDLREKAVADVSFAFAAFAFQDNSKGFARARTRRGAEIKRIQESRVNPLAKCNMTEYWQCAHSLALAAAVQFGGTPQQKKLPQALLRELCKEGDEETFARLAGRLASTASECEGGDGTRGVLVDHKELVKVCESEATLLEYMFGAVAVGKAGASEQAAVQKCILTGSGKVDSTREELEEMFRGLAVHCAVRDEYRKLECYLEILEEEESDTEAPDTEAPDTEKSVKMEQAVKKELVKMEEAVKKEADDKEPRRRMYTSKGKNKEVDGLWWNRTFQKHPPGPISSFRSDGAPGV